MRLWGTRERAGGHKALICSGLSSGAVDIGPWLFCNKFGKSYIDEETGEASGWDSIWGRFMDRLLAETKVKERFTEHDLRAKAGGRN